jgi:hypothetical protein
MPAGRRSLPLSPFFSRAGLPALLLLAGCAGLHIDSRPPRIRPSEVAQHGLHLRAAALRDRELNWEIFDEDLPALGITAVWVELENRRNAPGRPAPMRMAPARRGPGAARPERPRSDGRIL